VTTTRGSDAFSGRQAFTWILARQDGRRQDGRNEGQDGNQCERSRDILITAELSDILFGRNDREHVRAAFDRSPDVHETHAPGDRRAALPEVLLDRSYVANL
jgi:hypothetical protein